MSPAVAEIVSKATANARCAWEAYRCIHGLEAAGMLMPIFEVVRHSVGQPALDDAHWLCGCAMEDLTLDYAGAWRE